MFTVTAKTVTAQRCGIFTPIDFEAHQRAGHIGGTIATPGRRLHKAGRSCILDVTGKSMPPHSIR
jgi:hypothetical protein